MPIYVFEHPSSGEVLELVQRMSDEHKHVDEKGVEWNRIWSVPQASIDTHINAESSSDFVHKTRDKKGTVGDLWALSKEMSDKRAQLCGGQDPVHKKYERDQRKLRKGKKLGPDKRG